MAGVWPALAVGCGEVRLASRGLAPLLRPRGQKEKRRSRKRATAAPPNGSLAETLRIRAGDRRLRVGSGLGLGSLLLRDISTGVLEVGHRLRQVLVRLVDVLLRLGEGRVGSERLGRRCV